MTNLVHELHVLDILLHDDDWLIDALVQPKTLELIRAQVRADDNNDAWNELGKQVYDYFRDSDYFRSEMECAA